MNIQYWFSLFSLIQGTIVFGLTGYILYYYLPKQKGHIRDAVRWYIVSGALSYVLLTFATIKTAAFHLWDWGDIWYWIVTLGYIIGDISLAVVFREAVKEERKKKINNQ